MAAQPWAERRTMRITACREQSDRQTGRCTDTDVTVSVAVVAPLDGLELRTMDERPSALRKITISYQ